MIEVFKTNVSNQEFARQLVEEIHKTFEDYKANFDLDDCDHILRVMNRNGVVASSNLIDWLRSAGCIAEILPDI